MDFDAGTDIEHELAQRFFLSEVKIARRRIPKIIFTRVEAALLTPEIRKDLQQRDWLHARQSMFCAVVTSPSDYAACNDTKISGTWR